MTLKRSVLGLSAMAKTCSMPTTLKGVISEEFAVPPKFLQRFRRLQFLPSLSKQSILRLYHMLGKTGDPPTNDAEVWRESKQKSGGAKSGCQVKQLYNKLRATTLN